MVDVHIPLTQFDTITCDSYAMLLTTIFSAYFEWVSEAITLQKQQVVTLSTQKMISLYTYIHVIQFPQKNCMDEKPKSGSNQNPRAVIGEIFGHNRLGSECLQVQLVTC